MTAGCGKQDNRREAEEIYGTVYENWQEAKQLIYGALIETGEEVTDESGQAYLMVEELSYQNLEDVRKVLQSAFSTAYIETNLSWVLEGSYPLYREIDGRLCVAEMDAVGEFLADEIVSVGNFEKDKIQIKVASEDAVDPLTLYEITLVKEGSGWVIDEMQEAE
ncbi:MAG: hypothetical protein NC432_13770 [Roseburia sp.]|nr:hypothetical protein [Roseburia sp.]